MKPLSVAWLIGLGLLGVGAGAIYTAVVVSFGASPSVPTLLLVALFAGLAGALCYLGRQVKRLKTKSATWMTPIAAARTAAFARASTLAAPICAGLSLGKVLVALGRTDADYMFRIVIFGSLVALSALLWCIVAAIVERWCVVEGDDEEQPPTGTAPWGPGTPA